MSYSTTTAQKNIIKSSKIKATKISMGSKASKKKLFNN
jgi:hypothetical protein